MHVRVLGASAGGGLPQWNCGCPNCTAARADSPDIRSRTQSSVAVSGDGQVWFLLNVSPDIRQQLADFPALGPPDGKLRGTAIGGCVITNAELDHTTGLYLLREGCQFSIYSTSVVRRWLNQYNRIEPVVTSFADRPWFELTLDEPFELQSPDDGPSGLCVRAFETDCHVPRFVSEEAERATDSEIGLVIDDLRTGGRFVYVPCVAALDDALFNAVEGADCILCDGTFWSDDEPQQFGIANRTSREMGHVPVDGPEGTLAWLADLPIRHRVYAHINNTNPMLNHSSPQYKLVRQGGVQVGQDGDHFEL
ncbi:MAG: pyrroloquinoline quinone biosynthesis protein PqqB [Pirellulaceae bacterium]|jgi:pyrroloquinoline quinone biosynthesis protein B|nr:pyrroloquinoline quinone biosynthesis protein PqqB [Pirellulaceae bacterium]HJN66608.1 pyrroloquinoline quinone biosynthesis protein PqqB [Pirellulales bacterium]